MSRARRLILALVVAGALAGVTLLAFEAFGVDDDEPKTAAKRPAFDVLYRPPTFVSRGRPVELAFELVCPLPEPVPPEFCVPEGDLNVRRTDESDFDAIALTGASHRASAAVPAEYTTGSGFDYYVEIRDERGNERTVPAAGAKAPQRSWAITGWTDVDLGSHTFGKTRPGRPVVAATWGSGARSFGRLRTVGPSAFDVARDGTIVILDQVNRRLAFYPQGGSPRLAPIEFLGGEGDLAIGDDSTIYVLDGGRPREHIYFVRSYDGNLKPLASTQLAVGTQGDMLRAGGQGVIVHTFPSEQWLPVGAGRDLLDSSDQEAGARPGQTFRGEQEVAVDANRRETRIALFDSDGNVSGSWRIESGTPLGEVQLVAPYRDGLLAVLRVYSKNRSEWLILRLTSAGVAKSFSVRPVEAFDSAASSRFRLRGNVLYELQSSRAGLRIVKHDLGD